MASGRADFVGGRGAAIRYTLIRTAALNGLDPEAYLRGVLARIAEHPVDPCSEPGWCSIPAERPSVSEVAHRVGVGRRPCGVRSAAKSSRRSTGPSPACR